MPIDPEVSAEISAIKNKLLKFETDMAGLSGKELDETKKKMTALETQLAKLLEVKPDTIVKRDPPAGAGDPLGAFIESGEV